jgi:hypothetical protein
LRAAAAGRESYAAGEHARLPAGVTDWIKPFARGAAQFKYTNASGLSGFHFIQ